MSCKVEIDGKKYQVKAKTFKEVREELLKRGILTEGEDLRIQRLEFFVPEINKTIIMVAKFRPDLSISPHGEILYSITPLTKEEANIIKRRYPRLFAIIEEGRAEYVV